MWKNQLPYCTIFLSIATLIYSFYAAFDISGSLFGKVRIVQLEEYGAIRIEHLFNLEFWRLLTSQLIHVKQFHMLFNVISLMVLGSFLERHIGAIRMFVLWFIAGSAGTLFSTLFVTPPWNLGTGASQAIMGLAALGVLVVYSGVDPSKWLKYALGLAIIPALSLDLIFAHYPKPGHVLGFVVGLFIGLYYFKKGGVDAGQYANSTGS